MLQAVHVIHEEKIVHSDLKPANFVLVRGQLKLIDFGIANAIANDTTNIQRDHQVRLSHVNSVFLVFTTSRYADWDSELHVPRSHRATRWDETSQSWTTFRCVVVGVHIIPDGIWCTAFPAFNGVSEDESYTRCRVGYCVSRVWWE